MPGRRGERRRPVTALTTGRWAATLLTLALLSPLAGVAHGSGEPAPAPSRAHSPLPRRTSTRRARRDTRARCPSCAEGWSPGASTRSTTRWCCATTRWRRTPPPRRTPRSARAPPSSAPGSYSSTATGTPPRTPRPPRGKWSAQKTSIDPTAEHHRRALHAADAIIAKAKRTRRLHDTAAASMREFRHERAFWTAGEALRTSWRSYDLHIIRAKAGVEMDLYASVRQDVARALKIRPQSPDALRTLAEALRRCVRTVRALRASAGVLRDCLRANPDDRACRRYVYFYSRMGNSTELTSCFIYSQAVEKRRRSPRASRRRRGRRA